MAYYKKTTAGREWVYNEAGDQYLVRIMKKVKLNPKDKFTKSLIKLSKYIKENKINLPYSIILLKIIIINRIHHSYETPKQFHPPSILKEKNKRNKKRKLI